MPAEERREARLAALEEVACGEGEEAGEQQEDHQEDVGNRGAEVTRQLPFHDRPDHSHAVTRPKNRDRPRLFSRTARSGVVAPGAERNVVCP